MNPMMAWLGALLASALWLPLGHAQADELRQSDWAAGPGQASSSDLATEAAFASVTGQWSVDTAGELGARAVVFRSGTAVPTRSLRAIESASSALAYVGFMGCEVALTDPAPECRAMRFFVHRDTTTGVVSLVSVADGSDTMGCSGAYEASFTASSGVTLVHSDEQDDVTLVGGVGMVSHAWNNGCGDGFILQLPNSGASVDGAITSRTNLQQLQVVADAAGGVLVDVPLASLPNNGAPGTPVPFYFASGLTGSLESSVFALGNPRGLVGLAFDAQVGDATVAVYLRTGASEVDASTAAWSGPFASGAVLSSVPPGAFLQYRVDVTLSDVSGTPGAPEAFARFEELRIDLDEGCDCSIDGQCYDAGDLNAANVCERCNPGVSSALWTAVDDGDPCDDGRFCTGSDACLAGSCVGGASPCGDGLGCTDDVCDESVDACDNVVASGCVIDAACVASGASNPLDACEVCDPLRPLQWSVASGCSGCNTSDDCSAPGLGVCDLGDHACVQCTPAEASACGPLAPVCDAVARACRGCTSDAECGDPSAPYCGPNGQCVACERHLDCPSNAPICASGDCLVCVNSVECFDRDPGAGLCNEDAGTCGACLDASECRDAAGGSVCITATEGNRCGCVAEADCGVGFTCDVPRRRCFPLATADSDDDSVPDDKDADDDNDGITDLVEGAGADYSLDHDQDGTPNWRDDEALGFLDLNGNGTDDRSDADGDGVPNQLDLDADGDGIPDTLENAGRDVLDANRDGRLDDTRDRDRDGLVTTADADDDDPEQTVSVVTVRDTDANGTPDYLDLDSDAEGATDTTEAGGTDADEDGRLDGTSDGNMNGLVDRVDVMAGGTALPLPDADRDGIWDFQDASDAPRVDIRGGALCSAGHGAGASQNGAVWLGLGLGLLVFRRGRWGLRRRRG
ncbi:MAG: hypothetical protein KBB95_03990 [Deltaproteobacteria bacterium]|nr:hypothetical protein [Deltaproteobacteria bacterium]